MALAASVTVRRWTDDGFFGFGLAAVAASVWFGGAGPALLSTVVFLIGSRLLLLPPILSWRGPGGAAEVRWYFFIAVSALITVLGAAMWRARARAERSRQAAEQAARQASMLADMGAALDSAATLSEAAQLLVDRVVANFAEVAVVDVAGENGRPTLVRAAHRDPPGPAVGGVDGAMAWRERLLAAGPSASVTVPLTARGERIGALLLGHGNGSASLDDGDRRFAADLGTRAGLALANVALREQEHAVAHELQRTLLPRQLPQPPGVVVGAFYLPAQAEFMVGGDWYDVLELPSGRLGLVVGDVAGHGLAAAASMGQLRSALAGLALTSDQPAMLVELAQQFSERLGTSMFATVALASLDPADGSLSYACAGHPPPLVIRPGRDAAFLWEGRSTPIGFRAGGRRQQAEARLAVGETLLLYTDGLVESRHEYISRGFDRLAVAAATLADRPVDQLCRELTELMIGARASRDDIAVLAVRRARSS